jgi:hypothetical protein
LNFQYLTTEFGLAKSYKTKVEKAFFFIFMSSCTEMSFLGPKQKKGTKQGQKIFVFKSFDMGIEKSIILR